MTDYDSKFERSKIRFVNIELTTLSQLPPKMDLSNILYRLLNHNTRHKNSRRFPIARYHWPAVLFGTALISSRAFLYD